MSKTEPAIIRGGWVIRGSGPSDTIRDGAVLVEGGRISAVGAWDELSSTHPDVPVTGSERTAVIPGMVNAHHHSGQLSYWLHGIGDDLLEPWILLTNLARSPSAYTGTAFSAARLIRSGITTVIDMCGAGGTADEMTQTIRQKAKAYQDVGLRVRLAPGATVRSLLIHGEDEEFLTSLPADLRADVTRHILDAPRLSSDAYLDGIEALHGEFKDDSHVSVWFGPPGPPWVETSTMQECACRAARLGTGVQTHVVESYYEKLESHRHNGKSAVEHLKELGVLDGRFSMAHGVWVTERDIGILAETGAGISHNPSSNLRLRAGIAPLNALLAGGVLMGLGLDATTINDDDDMFNEMRLALRLHRTTRMGGDAPTVAQVFDMATVGGAKIAGLEGEAGRIDPGYRADLVVLDLDRLSWPWMAPDADPLETIVMRANATDVNAVFVEGNMALKDGRPTGVDLNEIGSALHDQLEAASVDADYAATVRALIPYLEKWYASWESPERNPYQAMNSRS